MRNGVRAKAGAVPCARISAPRQGAASGVNSVGRVPASQAGCRGFEPRTPLQFSSALLWRSPARCGQSSLRARFRPRAPRPVSIWGRRWSQALPEPGERLAMHARIVLGSRVAALREDHEGGVPGKVLNQCQRMSQRHDVVRASVYEENRAANPRCGGQAVSGLEVAPEGSSVPPRWLVEDGGGKTDRTFALRCRRLVVRADLSLIERVQELLLAGRADQDHGGEGCVRCRHQAVEAAHARPPIADRLGVYLRHLAQDPHGSKHILLHRTIGKTFTIPMAPKIQGEHCKPLVAGLQTERLVPRAPAAGTVAHDEPWDSGRTRLRRQKERGGEQWTGETGGRVWGLLSRLSNGRACERRPRSEEDVHQVDVHRVYGSRLNARRWGRHDSSRSPSACRLCTGGCAESDGSRSRTPRRSRPAR